MTKVTWKHGKSGVHKSDDDCFSWWESKHLHQISSHTVISPWTGSLSGDNECLYNGITPIGVEIRRSRQTDQHCGPKKKKVQFCTSYSISFEINMCFSHFTLLYFAVLPHLWDNEFVFSALSLSMFFFLPEHLWLKCPCDEIGWWWMAYNSVWIRGRVLLSQLHCCCL